MGELMTIEDVRKHDIWTKKDNGNDYAVESVGYHTEHAELTVAFVNHNGSVFYMPMDKFIDEHELTHRLYTDI